MLFHQITDASFNCSPFPTHCKLHLKQQLYIVWILVPCTRLLEFINIFYEKGRQINTLFI